MEAAGNVGVRVWRANGGFVGQVIATIGHMSGGSISSTVSWSEPLSWPEARSVRWCIGISLPWEVGFLARSYVRTVGPLKLWGLGYLARIWHSSKCKSP